MAGFDLVIRGGTVIDGSGAPPVRADVAIRDGVIAAIGSVDGVGHTEIDATGQLVTPGFVDVHTHYDGQVTWENRLVPSTNHGVTTVVMGNCGVGFAPCRPEHRDLLVRLMEGVEDIPNVVLSEGVDWQWTTYPEYLDHLASPEFDADVCSYVPHAALRTYVMGERAYRHEPATENEYAGLTDALARAGAGVVQFVIEYDDEWARVLDMGLRQAGAAGRPFSMSLVQSHRRPTLWRDVLDRIDAANDAGGRATVQVLPRPLGVLLGLELTLHPFYATPTVRALADRPLADQLRELRRPEVKAAVLSEANSPDDAVAIAARVQDFDHLFEMHEGFDYEPAAETSIGAQAARLGVSPESLAYDRLVAGDGTGILYLAFSNYADYSLEPSREMLTNPNAILGLDDRGLVAPGYRADLNVIDPDALALELPRVVRDLPAGGRRLMQDARGYSATIVAGVVVSRDGQHTGALPGRLVRGPQPSPTHI